MANKLLGRLEEKPNNFGGTEIRIGFTRADLEFMMSKLNDKDWVNVTQKTSKAGKPYIDFWERDAPAPVSNDAQAPDGQGDDLPF